MPKITYIEHNGKEHQIEMPVGYSIMEGAIKHSVQELMLIVVVLALVQLVMFMLMKIF